LPRGIWERLRERHLRRFLIESPITHEPPLHRWWRRHTTKERPTLFHLVICLTDHCNLKCRGCELYSCLAPEAFTDLSQTQDSLQLLSETFADIEEIYLMGGEPLLHPELAQFIAAARTAFPHTRLVVLSNGILARRISAELWQVMADHDAVLVLDSYPIPINRQAIIDEGATHGVTVEQTEEVQEFFRFPIDPGGGQNPRRALAACRGRCNCATLKDGKLYPCGRAPYAYILKDHFNLEGLELSETDGRSLDGGWTGDQLIDFLSRPIPWCRHCDADHISFYPWQRSKNELGEWIDPCP
jgi:MoaA/NifB/PqqE/SkfB family radical SAM enzyme